MWAKELNIIVWRIDIISSFLAENSGFLGRIVCFESMYKYQENIISDYLYDFISFDTYNVLSKNSLHNFSKSMAS